MAKPRGGPRQRARHRASLLFRDFAAQTELTITGRTTMHRSMRLPMLASVALLAFCGIAQAQQQAPQSPNMTFFVTGNGPGKGADLGGLAGADAHCQMLAQGAGAGAKTWHA